MIFEDVAVSVSEIMSAARRCVASVLLNMVEELRAVSYASLITGEWLTCDDMVTGVGGDGWCCWCWRWVVEVEWS